MRAEEDDAAMIETGTKFQQYIAHVGDIISQTKILNKAIKQVMSR